MADGFMIQDRCFTAGERSIRFSELMAAGLSDGTSGGTGGDDVSPFYIDDIDGNSLTLGNCVWMRAERMFESDDLTYTLSGTEIYVGYKIDLSDNSISTVQGSALSDVSENDTPADPTLIKRALYKFTRASTSVAWNKDFDYRSAPVLAAYN